MTTPTASDSLLVHNTPGQCPQCGDRHPYLNWGTALEENWECQCGAQWTIYTFVRHNPHLPY